MVDRCPTFVPGDLIVSALDTVQWFRVWGGPKSLGPVASRHNASFAVVVSCAWLDELLVVTDSGQVGWTLTVNVRRLARP